MKWLVSFILGNPLDRVLKSVDGYLQTEAAKEKARGDIVSAYMQAQVAVINGPGWRWMMFFMALFILPYGAWWALVCVYSMFWCAGCMYPVTWTVAALPEPLNTHGGYIIASLFVGTGGMAALNKWAGRK